MPRKKGRGRGAPPQGAAEAPVQGRGRGAPQGAAEAPVQGAGAARQEPQQQYAQPQQPQRAPQQQLQPPRDLPQQQQQQQQRVPQQQQQQQQRVPQQQQQQQRVPQQQQQQQQQRVPQQQPQPPRDRPQQQQQQQQQAQEHGGARRRVPPAVISGAVIGLQQQMSSLSVCNSNDFPKQQVGSLGRKIGLIANHYKVDLPKGSVFHYDVDIRPVKKKNGKNGKGSQDEKPKVGVKPEGLPRKLNAGLCRKIIEFMLDKYGFKRSHWPAYDGNKNLYTRKRLPIEQPTQFQVDFVKVPGDPGSMETFQVTIKPTEKEGTGDCEVSLEPLHQLSEGRVTTYPEETILALDIILRYGPTLKFVPVGRSFYMKPRSADEIVMDEGRAIWFGYYQSLRPGWKPLPKGFQTNFFLNIDKSTTAFLRPLNLVEFSLEVLHMRSPPAMFSTHDVYKLNKELKKVQVQAVHLPYPRKYKIVKVLNDKANSLTFDFKGKTITVEKYFQVQYNKKLKYPNYPCVQVGDPSRKIFIPMEMCRICDDQPSPGKLTPSQSAAMIKHTAVKPMQRFEEIKYFLKQTIDNNKEYLKEFEINISQDPVQFLGRVLPAPSVEYQNSNKAHVRDGQWEMRGKSFVNARTMQKWVIFSLCHCKPDHLYNFKELLRKSGQNSGMTISDTCAPPKVFPRVGPGDVHQILADYKRSFPELELAVVVLPKMSPLYKEVKHEGETNIGLITQCVTDDNLFKCQRENFSMRFLMNLCQKINAKLGGTNVSLQRNDKPDIFRTPVIVIGADVTHPAPGASDGYSIAACVGSVDAYPAKYVTKIQIQKVHSEVRAREERILDLNVMIKSLLIEFNRHTRQKPERIVYFRDGVSEGQFMQVRNHELMEIRKACSSLHPDYKPKISFIVVQKRHHTRFAPQNFKDGVEKYNYNVPAGTTVDTDITHPSYFNFFLASHVALQGTTRPAHYTVLWDDNDFTADVLQKFVFYICHTYNRCTRSISIPPPVMYADLAAYRAKLYIDNKNEKMTASSVSSDSSSESLLEEITKSIVTTDNVKNQMYFV